MVDSSRRSIIVLGAAGANRHTRMSILHPGTCDTACLIVHGIKPIGSFTVRGLFASSDLHAHAGGKVRLHSAQAIQ